MRSWALVALVVPLSVTQAFFGRKIDIVDTSHGLREAPVGTVLGTMTWGGQTEFSGAEAQLRLAFKMLPKPIELDTARMYVSGGTEELLGKLLDEKTPELKGDVVMATKANPFPTHNKNLSGENVQKQLADSLEAMRMDDVEIFYLHAPDKNTPLPETLAAVQKLYKKKRFRELGLSNFPAWQVVQIWSYMKSRGWVVPTVYQGMYNAITRDVEKELLPALRALNIRFYAYNPLAGGLLTGRYKDIESLQDTETSRFTGAGVGKWYGVAYQDRFWKQGYFDAIEAVKAEADPLSISMVEASLRWLYHHSQLSGDMGDKVIVAGSKTSHIEQNLQAVSAGPLPEAVVNAWENAWQIAKADCPPYFR